MTAKHFVKTHIISQEKSIGFLGYISVVTCLQCIIVIPNLVVIASWIFLKKGLYTLEYLFNTGYWFCWSRESRRL